MDESQKGLIFSTVVVVALIVVVLSGALLAARQECLNTGEVMDVAVEWRAFGGCFLEFDSQMVPEGQWYFLRFDVPFSGGE